MFFTRVTQSFYSPQRLPKLTLHSHLIERLHEDLPGGLLESLKERFKLAHAYAAVARQEPFYFEQIAGNEWFKTAQLRPYVKLYEEEFIVMPNHVHGIIWIEMGDGGDTPAIARARRRRAPTNDHIERFGKPVSHSIATIVRAYKSAVTYAANNLQHPCPPDRAASLCWMD